MSTQLPGELLAVRVGIATLLPQPSQRSSQLLAVLNCIIPVQQQLHCAPARIQALVLAVQPDSVASELP